MNSEDSAAAVRSWRGRLGFGPRYRPRALRSPRTVSWLLASLTCLLLGCRPAAPGTPNGGHPPASKPVLFSPHPLLELARSEREAPNVRYQTGSRRPNREPLDTVLDEDGIERTIRVRPGGAGSIEDALGAVLRNAEARRPRELHPTRFLLRARNVRAPSRAVRRRVREFAEASRSGVILCLTEELATRPDVFLRTPTSLVLEEALRTGPIAYTVSVQFRRLGAVALKVSPPVGEVTLSCLHRTFSEAEEIGSASALLSIFSQRAVSYNGMGAMHRSLALGAAILGWIAYERGVAEDALAYFEDAYWLYHRPEYQLLQGLALEELGAAREAITRYRSFVDAYPLAPETPSLRTRIGELERVEYSPSTNARMTSFGPSVAPRAKKE